MDALHFDHLTRSLSATLSRRTVAGALGLGALAIPGLLDAKKKKRKKKKKVKRNDFGCVDVGGFCKNGGQCCSGICKGKKDKKKCKAHDTGGCTANDDSCAEGSIPCTTATGGNGSCLVTTGKAGYCQDGGGCFACTKDADCVPLCGAHAACVMCAECDEIEGFTACVGPSGASC